MSIRRPCNPTKSNRYPLASASSPRSLAGADAGGQACSMFPFQGECEAPTAADADRDDPRRLTRWLLSQTGLKPAFSVRETAHLLSLGRTSLYEHVKAGRLKATKCGRRTLFLAPDIAEFLARLQQREA